MILVVNKMQGLFFGEDHSSRPNRLFARSNDVCLAHRRFPLTVVSELATGLRQILFCSEIC